MKPLLSALLVQLVLLQFLHAQAPMPDLSFGTNGIMEFPPIPGYKSGDIRLIGSDNSGALYFQVSSREYTAIIERSKILKILPNGEPDKAYNEKAPEPYQVNAYAVSGKGELYVASQTFNSSQFIYQINVQRYLPDGTPDPDYGTGGVANILMSRDLFPLNIYMDRKDRVLVSGKTFGDRFLERFYLVRLLPDGKRDSNFGNAGEVLLTAANSAEKIRDIFFTEDHRINTTGLFESYTIIYEYLSQFRNEPFSAIYSEDGTPDKRFNGNGRVLPGPAGSGVGVRSRMLKDGSIITAIQKGGGWFSDPSFHLVRHQPDGSQDTSFGNDGTLEVTTPWFVVTPRQQIVVLAPDANTKEAVLRFYLPDGTPDPSVGAEGVYKVSLPAPFLAEGLNDLYYAGGRLLIAGQVTDSITIGILAAFTFNAQEPLQCPAPKVVATDKGSCSALVSGLASTNTNASIRYRLEGATSGTGSGVPDKQRFNKGVTTVTYWPESNPEQTCSFTVEVQDREAPAIAGLKPSQSELRVPNHKMQDVALSYNATDNCGIKQLTVTVSSNEPVRGAGSGDTAPDWEVVSPTLVRLRAERSAQGNGRVYTITVTAEDESGNRSGATTQVRVPKGNGRNAIVSADKHYDMEDSRIRILPLANPASGAFTVQVGSGDVGTPVTLRLVDMQGRLVARMQVFPNTQHTIGANLNKGIYLLEAIQGNMQVNTKLVCQ